MPASKIQSPCIDTCVIEPASRLCIGCLRSIDEIAAWGGMSDAARALIMAELPARKPQLSKRKGGRVARLKR
ncbi:MAG: putative Fe-S protein YdhL (DUF1289 family) [Halocynthiibacter sp.]|jgi:predicted Fe-S protein YdhL (DUF1289 family)